MCRSSPGGAFDHSCQFSGSAPDGLIQCGCVLGDSDRMTPLETSLHHAALVVLAAFAAILIAQVDLDPRYVIAGADQGALNGTRDPRGKRFVTLDVMVGVYLNLHSLFLIVLTLIAGLLLRIRPTRRPGGP
jgi:hypothetical protein